MLSSPRIRRRCIIPVATCHETNYLGKFMKICMYNWPICGKEKPYGQNFIGNSHMSLFWSLEDLTTYTHKENIK